MAVDDLWHLKERGTCTWPGCAAKYLPSQRHERGKRWRVRYTDPDGIVVQKLFDKKVDADRYDTNVRADVLRDEWTNPEKKKISVRQYAEQHWLPGRRHRDTTSERLERDLRLHVFPILGDKRIFFVDEKDVELWLKDLMDVNGRGLRVSTVQVIYWYMKAMFTHAERRGYVKPTANPFRQVAKPTDDSDRGHFVPTAEQVRMMADALPRRYGALALVAAGSGLRQGELWGLELEHVDMEAGTITVVQQHKQLSKPTIRKFLAPPKTATSRRTVEIAGYALDALRRHIEEFPPVDVFIDDDTDRHNPRHRAAKLLFTTVDRQPLNRAQWAHMWTPARKRTGLPVEFTFHDLRHYFATVLIEGGASVKTVQLALGHANPMITLNTYVGSWPDRVTSFREALDADWHGAMLTQP